MAIMIHTSASAKLWIIGWKPAGLPVDSRLVRSINSRGKALKTVAGRREGATPSVLGVAVSSRSSCLVSLVAALGGCATIVGADFDDLKSRASVASDSGAVPPSGVDGSASSGADGTSGGGGTSGSNAPAGGGGPADGGCTPTTFYEDKDGDGWGSAKTVQACAASAGLTDRTGDCDDGNESVFPGQTKYFATPYTTPLGKASFDYDCNGSEDPTPDLVQFQSFPICNSSLVCVPNDTGRYCWEPQHALRTTRGAFDKCGARAWVCLAPAGWNLATSSENLKAYPCR